MSAPPIFRPSDAEPEAFPWGGISWLVNGERVPDAEQTFGLVFINPGASNPPHYHPNCEEILYVLSGRCAHQLGDEVYEMGPGDAIHVPSGVVHHAHNPGREPLRAVISFSSADRKTVFVESG